jgi:hypothetical protein
MFRMAILPDDFILIEWMLRARKASLTRQIPRRSGWSFLSSYKKWKITETKQVRWHRMAGQTIAKSVTACSGYEAGGLANHLWQAFDYGPTRWRWADHICDVHLDSHHQVEPDTAEMGERYGGETTVPDWRARLVSSECGSRRVDMVVSGTERY